MPHIKKSLLIGVDGGGTGRRAAIGTYLDGVLALFEGDAKAIVEFSLPAKPGDYRSLAPAIISAANDGDQWACATMKRGAHFLAGGLSRLGFHPGDPLCLIGGLGSHYANYLPAELLSGRVAAKGNALDGAFALARIGALKSDETSPFEAKMRGVH